MKYAIWIYSNGELKADLSLIFNNNDEASWFVIKGIVDDALECYYGEPTTKVVIMTDNCQKFADAFELTRKVDEDDNEEWSLFIGDEDKGSDGICRHWDSYLSGWL